MKYIPSAALIGAGIYTAYLGFTFTPTGGGQWVLLAVMASQITAGVYAAINAEDYS